MRRTVLDLTAVTAMRVACVLAVPLLLVLARTRRGRLLGFATVPLATIPVWYGLALWGFDQSFPGMGPASAYPRWLVTAAALGGLAGMAFSSVVAVVTFAVVVFTSPRFRSDASPGFASVFLGPTWLYRWQLGLVAEEDALWLGAWLVSRCDPRMTRADARQLRAGVRELLDEIADVPEYRLLPPAWPFAVWGKALSPDHGHFLAYVPPVADGERLGLLVALHGHGGNAVLWLHSWRDFADEHRFAVVCPSFGYGNWEHPDSPTAVDRCVEYAVAHHPVDAGRVVLAGLSQGGCGVGRAAAAFPGRFAGLVFLSATMEPAVLGGEGLAGAKVFVAFGGRDVNVKPATVERGIAALRTGGADVTEHRDPAGDHFLFFEKRTEIQQRIAEWLG